MTSTDHSSGAMLALRAGPLATSYVPRRGYADGPYGQVHFRDTGEGIPLVLCHQSPQTSRQFTNVYEPLSRLGIRAIGVDTPGFGESDPAGFVPKIEDWAGTIPAVLDHLGISQADVLGHHTGGMIAAEVALQFPERVRKLVVNGPMPASEQERRELLDDIGMRELNFVYEDDGSHLQHTFQVRKTMYGKDPNPKTLTRYVMEKFQGYAPFWVGHHAAFVYDQGAALKRVEHPTLILTNTGDSIYEHAQRTRALRPDFDYTELAGGGIDIVDQLPEAWAAAVADFLKR